VGNEVKVGLLGAGTVGGALLELLKDRESEINQAAGCQIVVKKILVKDPQKKRLIGADSITFDSAEVVSDPEIDIVVELMGGLEPSKELVIKALSNKKPVITANKALIATYAEELFTMADNNGVDLYYEASVGGAIPLIRILRESLAGERINKIIGIVNGTTNYILSEMSSKDLSFEEALNIARQLGYAEADPSNDLDGLDAAAKAAIMASIAFNTNVSLKDVYVETMRNITAADISFADQHGFSIKLLAIVEKLDEPEELSIRVYPSMISKNHPLASVNGAFNAIFIHGSASGDLMLYGLGAGGNPTASAVIGDLIDATHNLISGHKKRSLKRSPLRIKDISELCSRYYLAMDVDDKPGVLADVASLFGKCGVSILSMEQIGIGPAARLVFITHLANEEAMKKTLKGLSQLKSVIKLGNLIRITDAEN
jgi:homoserine dehydrogenase